MATEFSLPSFEPNHSSGCTCPREFFKFHVEVYFVHNRLTFPDLARTVHMRDGVGSVYTHTGRECKSTERRADNLIRNGEKAFRISKKEKYSRPNVKRGLDKAKITTKYTEYW